MYERPSREYISVDKHMFEVEDEAMKALYQI